MLLEKTMWAGTMRKRDARLWAHWWTVRGHNTRLEVVRPGVFACYLTLTKKVR